MHGFVRLSSRSPHGRNLRPPARYGSVPYRGSRAACVPESAADRSEKIFARAFVTSSANTFSSMRSHTLRKNVLRASGLALLRGRQMSGRERTSRRNDNKRDRRPHFQTVAPEHPLVAIDATVWSLSRSGVVEHRLVEVGYDIACAGGQFWRQCADDNPGARGGFQNGAWREGRCSLCKICGERLENQRHHIAVVVFLESSQRTPCPFPTLLSPALRLMARETSI